MGRGPFELPMTSMRGRRGGMSRRARTRAIRRTIRPVKTRVPSLVRHQKSRNVLSRAVPGMLS